MDAETRHRSLIRRALPLAAFLGVLVVLVAFAAFPTPILGTDGATLDRSLNGVLLGGLGPCREVEEGWRCSIMDEGSSSSATAYIVEVDRWGCWTATPKYGGPGHERTGCVNILDHLGVL